MTYATVQKYAKIYIYYLAAKMLVSDNMLSGIFTFLTISKLTEILIFYMYYLDD